MNDADAENIEGLKKFDEDDHPHEYGAESDDEYINFDKDDEKCQSDWIENHRHSNKDNSDNCKDYRAYLLKG